MKKIKTFIATIIALTLVLISPNIESNAAESVSTSATLIQMSDGGYFDPTFYMQTYPDVVALVGNDADSLYQHYIHYGQCYGFTPFSASDAALIQSVTYVPGNIVVPISVKTHPEGQNILLYSDANIDIYYRGTGWTSWIIDRPDSLTFFITVFNKSDKEITLSASTSSVNNQMVNMLLYANLFAGSYSYEKMYSTELAYTQELFDSVNLATLGLTYYLDGNYHDRIQLKINMVFTH